MLGPLFAAVCHVQCCAMFAMFSRHTTAAYLVDDCQLVSHAGYDRPTSTRAASHGPTHGSAIGALQPLDHGSGTVCQPWFASPTTSENFVGSWSRFCLIDTAAHNDYCSYAPVKYSLDSLLVAYNTTLSSLLDQHAPVITTLSKRKSKSNPWFTTTVRAFRSTVRRAENLWKRTHSALHRSSFKSLRNQYHRLILTRGVVVNFYLPERSSCKSNLVHFRLKIMTSGGNNFNDFPEK